MVTLLTSKIPHRWLLLILAIVMFVGCEDTAKTETGKSPADGETKNSAPADDQNAAQTASNDDTNKDTTEDNGQADTEGSDVEITLISGDQNKLAEIIAQQQGKVVLVDYWATWCGPCVQKFPHIIEMHKQYREQGLVVVTVSLDQPDAKEPVMNFLMQQQAGSINLLASMDMSTSADAFELSAGVPEYRIYDRAGNLDTVFKTDPTAEKPYTVEDIEAKVKELLANDAG